MRGIIADVKKGYAVLLNEHGEFVRIKDQNYKVGQKVNFKFAKYKFIYTMAASFVLFLMLGISGFTYYNTPSSYISIDINPSMQLGLNFMDRVVNEKPFNSDAKKVLENLDVKNKSVGDLVQSIVNEAKDLGYLNEKNNSVVIDILSDKQDLKDQITSSMKKVASSGVDVSVEKANRQQFDLSKKLNVSLGRVKAILDYTNTFGGTVTENKNTLDNETVGNIRKTINAKKNNTPSQSKIEENKNTENNGQQNSGNKPEEKKNEQSKPNVNNPKASDIKENASGGNIQNGNKPAVQSSSSKTVNEEVKMQSKPQSAGNGVTKEEKPQSSETKQESVKPEKTNQGKGAEKTNNGNGKK